MATPCPVSCWIRSGFDVLLGRLLLFIQVSGSMASLIGNFFTDVCAWKRARTTRALYPKINIPIPEHIYYSLTMYVLLSDNLLLMIRVCSRWFIVKYSNPCRFDACFGSSMSNSPSRVRLTPTTSNLSSKTYMWPWPLLPYQVILFLEIAHACVTVRHASLWTQFRMWFFFGVICVTHSLLSIPAFALFVITRWVLTIYSMKISLQTRSHHRPQFAAAWWPFRCPVSSRCAE